MNENLSMLLYFAFSCLWHASFALYCGWKLALAIFLTSAPIIAVATGVMSKFNTSAVRKEMKAYGEAGAVAAEMFSAVRTVFAFGGERKALELYDARLTPAVRSETRRSVVNSLGNALIWAGIYFGFAVGIWYGVRLMTTDHQDESVNESEVSIGTIIVVFWCSAAVGWNAGSAAPYYEHLLKACVVGKCCALLFLVITSYQKFDLKSFFDNLIKTSFYKTPLLFLFPLDSQNHLRDDRDEAEDQLCLLLGASFQEEEGKK